MIADNSTPCRRNPGCARWYAHAWYEEIAHLLGVRKAPASDVMRANGRGESIGSRAHSANQVPRAEMCVEVTQKPCESWAAMASCGTTRRSSIATRPYFRSTRGRARSVADGDAGHSGRSHEEPAALREERRRDALAFVRAMARAAVRQLRLLALGAQRHLIARTAGDKFRSLQDTPIAVASTVLKNWDQRDFAYAMLTPRTSPTPGARSLVEALWVSREGSDRRGSQTLTRRASLAVGSCTKRSTTGARVLRELPKEQEATARAAGERHSK